MSWLYSRALVAEYSAGNCSGGEPFAPSSSTPTPQAYLSHGKTTDAWNPSRYGMMSEHLTDDRGKELLTWFQADSRAKILARPVEAQESRAQGPAFGKKWHESLAKYDRDSRSWKIPQCSLFEGSESYLETWPRWGMMLGGECWELPTSAPRIDASEFGLCVPTPRANEAGCYTRDRGQKGMERPTLTGFAKMYPTPTASTGGPEPTGKTGRKLSTIVGGALNPYWVEWLMGWPTGWTALKPLGTGKFRQWLDSHGKH